MSRKQALWSRKEGHFASASELHPVRFDICGTVVPVTYINALINDSARIPRLGIRLGGIA
jgi:hypothetical protein